MKPGMHVVTPKVVTGIEPPNVYAISRAIVNNPMQSPLESYNINSILLISQVNHNIYLQLQSSNRINRCAGSF